MPETISNEALASSLIAALRTRRLFVATAESLTGGLIAGALTAVPGASNCVLGGFVTYTDTIKHRLLGVESTVLERESAVSEAVAIAMAKGARTRLGADLAVSATGYAGPDGGLGGPAGLVWIGIATAYESFARRLQLSGDRTAVRAASVAAALTLLLEQVTNNTQT